MATNGLTITQVSTVINSIVEQANGKNALAGVNTSDFVTVAQVAQKTAYDPLMSAISQVLSRTIFSIRPYSRKFKGLSADSIRFGNHVRKLSVSDSSAQNDGSVGLTDGASVDQFTVKVPKLLETNFYGQNVHEQQLTIFKDQVNTALRNAEEFASWWTMVTQNTVDLIEQSHENVARATLANFIGGKVLGDTGSVIHLLTEYNAYRGLTGEDVLTKETVREPETFKAFMQWAFGRIASLCSLLTERTLKYHVNVTGKELSRHTPYAKQKVYMYAPEQYQMSAQVLANTFHDSYLKRADVELVNFWQAIEKPGSINVKPTYMHTDGTLITAASASEVEDIFGVIFDEESMGYTTVNTSVDPSPYNAKGKYSNLFYHFTDRYWNDFTENGIILLMD